MNQSDQLLYNILSMSSPENINHIFFYNSYEICNPHYYPTVHKITHNKMVETLANYQNGFDLHIDMVLNQQENVGNPHQLPETLQAKSHFYLIDYDKLSFVSKQMLGMIDAPTSLTSEAVVCSVVDGRLEQAGIGIYYASQLYEQLLLCDKVIKSADPQIVKKLVTKNKSRDIMNGFLNTLEKSSTIVDSHYNIIGFTVIFPNNSLKIQATMDNNDNVQTIDITKTGCTFAYNH